MDSHEQHMNEFVSANEMNNLVHDYLMARMIIFFFINIFSFLGDFREDIDFEIFLEIHTTYNMQVHPK